MPHPTGEGGATRAGGLYLAATRARTLTGGRRCRRAGAGRFATAAEKGARLGSAGSLSLRNSVTLSADEVRSLPAVIDVVTAAQVLGIGRTVAYELVRTGDFPTPVLRVGGQVKIPTAPLLDLLGLAERPLPPTPPAR
jgi:hypothetical protein